MPKKAGNAPQLIYFKKVKISSSFQRPSELAKDEYYSFSWFRARKFEISGALAANCVGSVSASTLIESDM